MEKRFGVLRTVVAFAAAFAIVLSLSGFSGDVVSFTARTALAADTDDESSAVAGASLVSEPAPDPEPLAVVKQPLSFSELAPTTTMAFEELVGDNGIYDDETVIPPIPTAGTFKLVINEYHQFGTVFTQDANGEYTVPVRYFIVSSGSRSKPTPKGTFVMGNDYVRFGLFKSYGVYGQYWRQIVRSIYCHSLIYSKRNARSYTSSYDHLGSRASHGCVRMLVPDARFIYYHLGPGTVCEIIRGEEDDAAAAAIKAQLVIAASPEERPDLEAGSIPVTEAWPGWQGDAYAKYKAYRASLALDAPDTAEDGAEEGDAEPAEDAAI